MGIWNRIGVSRLRPKRIWLVTVGQVALLSGVFFGLTVAVADYKFGSLQAGRAYLSGARLVPKSSNFTGTYSAKDSEIVISYVIRNLDELKVTIAGITATCSCTVAENYPKFIPPKGEVEITARVSIDNKYPGGTLTGFLDVFTDHPIQPSIRLSYNLEPESGFGASK